MSAELEIKWNGSYINVANVVRGAAQCRNHLATILGRMDSGSHVFEMDDDLREALQAALNRLSPLNTDG